jgi:hypothetical protein
MMGQSTLYALNLHLKKEGSFEEQELVKSKPFVLKILDEHEEGSGTLMQP